jgi:hypothetical protein
MYRLLKRTQQFVQLRFAVEIFFLLDDNVPLPQNCKCLPIFDPKKVTTLYQPPLPPYYPDLSPPDYFLFPKLKMKLKELHIADVAEIQEGVTDELRKAQKRGIFGSFSETVRSRKSQYICQWSFFFFLFYLFFYFFLKFINSMPHYMVILHAFLNLILV